MWAILRTCGHVCAVPIADVMPSADWILVMRKVYYGCGTALSNRKSVQPSTKIVSKLNSSATGPSAGVLPLEMMPVNRSMLPSSFMRRSSLTLASVPAASSAVMVSILRLPRKPPCALISSAASVCPFSDGSPSTAAGPVRNVMCPVLSGLSGILPLGGSAAALTRGGATTRPAPARPVPPTVTPSAPRNFRRSTVLWLSILFLPSPGLLASRARSDVAPIRCRRNRTMHFFRARHDLEWPEHGLRPISDGERAVPARRGGLGGCVPMKLFRIVTGHSGMTACRIVSAYDLGRRLFSRQAEDFRLPERARRSPIE